ncbi:MAG: SUMF1/EgtB/PvdO family nonheme iron enzyme [Bacteroidetes bacterium]|nr:SUMF1/EgtB/PvdO family nonheme iron enzyme [Bacteroidota bacterium]
MKPIELKQTDTGYQLNFQNQSPDKQLTVNLVSIPGGSFQREDGQTVKVNSFCMAQFPVTQEFYKEVAGNDPSNFKGDQHPVEQVSWYDSVKFCGILNRELERLGLVRGSDLLKLDNLSEKDLDKFKLNPAASGFRLPTEAEGEYASNPTGFQNPSNLKKNQYAGSSHLDLVGWYDKNNKYETKPVGLKFPNAFGLYDMSGNVWEWRWDWYGKYDKRKTENPVGADSGSRRVVRGGSWLYDAFYCRRGDRINSTPGNRDDSLGFRLAFVP